MRKARLHGVRQQVPLFLALDVRQVAAGLDACNLSLIPGQQAAVDGELKGAVGNGQVLRRRWRGADHVGQQTAQLPCCIALTLACTYLARCLPCSQLEVSKRKEQAGGGGGSGWGEERARKTRPAVTRPLKHEIGPLLARWSPKRRVCLGARRRSVRVTFA